MQLETLILLGVHDVEKLVEENIVIRLVHPCDVSVGVKEDFSMCMISICVPFVEWKPLVESDY